MSRITAFSHINKSTAYLNGREILSYDINSEDRWLKQLYKWLGVSYPKFYKMDQLAQAGLVAFELLRTGNDLFSGYGDDEIAMVFANRTASAVTDLRFQESYLVHESPSPSLFVYTLPNIVMGELAILNKWYGENMFAVLPNFVPDFYVDYGQTIVAEGAEKAILAGWIEIEDNDPHVFLCLVEDDQHEGIDFTTANLQELYLKGK